ncbi:MAG: ATP-grasp domain-containing protein [Phycisphaerales bacterium]
MTQSSHESHGSADHRRLFSRLLADVARSRGDSVDELGDGWILRFRRGDTVRHAWGFNLELNSSAAHLLACDKSAASEVMAREAIPHVPHRAFLHPRMGPYAAREGFWRPAMECFEAWRRNVVVKDNNGTGGVGVYRATTPRGLEAAFLMLFQRVHAVCLCPYSEIVGETRFVLLDGECLLAFEKVRPTVTGDGVRPLRALAAGGGVEIDPETVADVEEILPAGATRLLSWRHNLGQGARAREIDPASHDGYELARRAARAVNLRFGSVDVVTTPRGNEILELNAGVMLEAVARQLPQGEPRARAIYQRAYDASW